MMIGRERSNGIDDNQDISSGLMHQYEKEREEYENGNTRRIV